MKDYQVSYYLGNMYHAYIISARNEDEVTKKVMKRQYYPELLHNLIIKRYFQEWN